MSRKAVKAMFGRSLSELVAGHFPANRRPSEADLTCGGRRRVLVAWRPAFDSVPRHRRVAGDLDAHVPHCEIFQVTKAVEVVQHRLVGRLITYRGSPLLPDVLGLHVEPDPLVVVSNESLRLRDMVADGVEVPFLCSRLPPRRNPQKDSNRRCGGADGKAPPARALSRGASGSGMGIRVSTLRLLELHGDVRDLELCGDALAQRFEHPGS